MNFEVNCVVLLNIKEVMSSILESLKAYFAKNSEEQVKKDWEDSINLDSIGPKVDEFLYQSKLLYGLEVHNDYWQFSFEEEINKSPKVTSDFFCNFVY